MVAEAIALKTDCSSGIRRRSFKNNNATEAEYDRPVTLCLNWVVQSPSSNSVVRVCRKVQIPQRMGRDYCAAAVQIA
jgi:hypothetical protein